LARCVAWLVCVVGLFMGCDPAPLPGNEEEFVPVFTVPDCRPNNDGVIDKDELPFVVGAEARVRIGENVDVDVAGKVIDGVRTWDLTRPEPKDDPIGRFSIEPMAPQWFAGEFSQDAIATPLVPGGAQLGPAVIDDDGVHLLGFASKDEAPAEGQTLAVYADDVVLYPFPLRERARVTSVTRADPSKLLGIVSPLEDSYDVEVTGRGTLVLADVILENTLLVTVRFSRTLIGASVHQVSHHFVHECLGEVARFSSKIENADVDIPDDFATAQEVWRLTL
jgi:hypothetical protein